MNEFPLVKVGPTVQFFLQSQKRRMRSGDFRWDMRRAACMAGFRNIRFHDLHHTFASNFIIKWGNIASLQRILEHSTINMTLRYAHLAPDFMAREVEFLDFRNQSSPICPRAKMDCRGCAGLRVLWVENLG